VGGNTGVGAYASEQAPQAPVTDEVTVRVPAAPAASTSLYKPIACPVVELPVKKPTCVKLPGLVKVGSVAALNSWKL